MTLLTFWAAAAALLASACLGLRANMLKPQFTSWTTAPVWVWVSIGILSVVELIVSASMFRGMSATPREAVVHTVLAVSSGIMLWNLERQAVERRRGVSP